MSNIIDMIPKSEHLDAIVVEGYDCVGKGRILRELSQYYGTTPYRPDYSFWQHYDIPARERWRISAYFWDIYSSLDIHTDRTLLFDRGVISGAVYNDDASIAAGYMAMLRSQRVLHILVWCHKQDYMKFLKSRNPRINPEECQSAWDACLEYQKRYREYLVLAGVLFIDYQNKFESDESEYCISCGHYSYGTCTNPAVSRVLVDAATELRCSHSTDREVQDVT